MNIPDLNETVVEALEFLRDNPPEMFDVSSYSFPFVVGSGNALNSGKILFANNSAVFCDESTFKSSLFSYQEAINQKLIQDAIVISASGEKDSVWEIDEAKRHGLKTTLLTCERNSSAAKIADKVYVYRKIAEPYTYNFSTYLGMVMSTTGEKSSEILKAIEKLSFPDKFDQYKSYSFILPDTFAPICPMLEIKRNELFGPHLALRAFSQGHARHAGFVHPWEEELVITLGSGNEFFGHPNHRWNIELEKHMSAGHIMAMTYFIIGKIQQSKPPYFKQNIEKFCQEYGPRAYGKNERFDVIVPGN